VGVRTAVNAAKTASETELNCVITTPEDAALHPSRPEFATHSLCHITCHNAAGSLYPV
jgi:hypothetical protein